MHLARVDALKDDSASVDTLIRKARDHASDELIGRVALHVRSLGGSPLSGSVDRQRLQRTSTLQRGAGARDVLTGIGADDTERYASQFLRPDIPGDLAGYGHRLSAYASAARGQFGAAFRHLDQAQESDADSDVEVRSLLVAIPESPVDSAVIAQTRLAVEAWKPTYTHDPDQSLDAIAHSRAHGLLRLHRLGLIALRSGDLAVASGLAARLGSAESDTSFGSIATVLESSLRARIAAAAGDSARALTLLDRVQWPRVGRVSTAEPLDLLLHADLLAAAGRHAEALHWYETLGAGAPSELPLVGYAALGMARTYERMGDRPAATRQYRRVAELWRSADAPLQSTVTIADRRGTTEEAPR